jgi:hypothetical protein
MPWAPVQCLQQVYWSESIWSGSISTAQRPPSVPTCHPCHSHPTLAQPVHIQDVPTPVQGQMIPCDSPHGPYIPAIDTGVHLPWLQVCM